MTMAPELSDESRRQPAAVPESPPRRVKLAMLGLFARGMAMGVAEVVPGVSGATIAFVTGIYHELVRSLAAFSLGSVAMLPRAGWRAFARRHNLTFLLVLGAGMLVSFLALARIVLFLLETQRVYVMGFFFGLIAGSVLHVGSQSSWRWLLSLGLVGLIAGLAAGLLLEPDSGAGSEVGMLAIFGAGALAAVAWILPGVSGAFVLLLLGLYKPMLEAVNGGDLVVVGTFATGLGVGIIAFSKLLSYLLVRARGPLLALLTGFMAGSLTQLWPWRGVPAEGVDLAAVLVVMAAGALTVGVLALAARGKDS